MGELAPKNSRTSADALGERTKGLEGCCSIASWSSSPAQFKDSASLPSPHSFLSAGPSSFPSVCATASMFSSWCEPTQFSMVSSPMAETFCPPRIASPPKGSRCVGCGSDNTIRIHYGAPSCHGCKAFFRRSVFEGRNYECCSRNQCDVTPVYRNRCRACRYNNCVNGGMNPKLVREERFKSAMGSSRSSSVNSTVQDVSPKSDSEFYHVKPEPIDEQFSLVDFLTHLERRMDTLFDADAPGTHGADEVQVWSQNMFRNMGINDGQNIIIQRTPMKWTCERILTTPDMYYAWYRAYVLLADWAMSIPEFRALPLTDQTTLFKENFSAFGWMTYAYRSYEGGYTDIGLPMGNGSYMPYKQEEQCQMDAQANTYGLVAKSVIELIVHPMRELGITFEEFCIMKTIALFQQDSRFSTKSAGVLDSYKEKLLTALATTIDNKFPNLTAMQKSVRAAKMSLLLPSFYNIGRIEAEMIRSLSACDLDRASGVPFVIMNNYRSNPF